MEKRVENLYLSDFLRPAAWPARHGGRPVRRGILPVMAAVRSGAASCPSWRPRYLAWRLRYSEGETPEIFRNTLEK